MRFPIWPGYRISIWILFLILLLECLSAKEYYHEDIYMQLVGQYRKHLLVQMTFNMTWEIEDRQFCTMHQGKRRKTDNITASSDNICAYDFFPPQLSEIVHHYDIEELGISLSNARWENDIWGSLPLEKILSFYQPPDFGAEVWTRTKRKEEEDLTRQERRWRGLLNQLGVLYRVPLGLMAGTPSSSSVYYNPPSFLRPSLLHSFFGEGGGAKKASDSQEGQTSFIYGQLTQTVLCLDNFWGAILHSSLLSPCHSSQYGLASLLSKASPSVLLNAEHFSYSLYLQRRQDWREDNGGIGEKQELWQMDQVVTLLIPTIEKKSSSSSSRTQAPRQQQQQQQQQQKNKQQQEVKKEKEEEGEKDAAAVVVLSELLELTHGSSSLSTCPLAATSRVHHLVAAASAQNNNKTLETTMLLNLPASSSRGSGFEEIFHDENFLRNKNDLSSEDITLSRSKGQINLKTGQLYTRIENQHPTFTYKAVLMETWPFFLFPNFAEMGVTVIDNSVVVSNTTTTTTTTEGRTVKSYRLQDYVLHDPHLLPGSSTSSHSFAAPYLLEYELMLPPASLVEVYIPFHLELLHFEAYPPNPNHGLEVPPVIGGFTIVNGEDKEEKKKDDMGSRLRLVSESVLIDVPMPDFSMPFNVITLSCTFLAFFFGSMINVLVKKKSKKEEEEEEEEKKVGKRKGDKTINMSLINRIVDRVKQKFTR